MMAEHSGKEIAKLYETQISLTEWLENIKHANTVDIRSEDNQKLDRLMKVNEVIDLPFDRPARFKADDLLVDNPNFVKFLESDGDRLCALRLMPLNPEMPKLRMRGLTVKGAFEWFKKQKIDPKKYTADFRSHANKCEWSSIFVINKRGISGEIVRDRLHVLSQGFYGDEVPIVFHFDWNEWKMSPNDPEALAELQRLTDYLRVADAAKQRALEKSVGATFVNDYLAGYFETIEAKDAFGLHFDDYSQNLGDMYSDYVININDAKADSANVIIGRGASAGIAQGKVRIVDDAGCDFEDGEILVAKVTTPNMVGLMKRAAAIITDKGGILSHAAIIARELGKPCVVDTKNATSLLKNGFEVSVDGSTGKVEVINEL